MAALPTVQPDITLLLDMEGVIREATLSPAMSGESIDGWLGRPWVEIAGDLGGDKIKRMVDDARVSGISAFRQMQSSIVTASATRGRTPRKPQRIELALHSHAIPAFGKADLSNCEREEIHLAGSIQPHGALLVVSEPDHRVVQVSANAAEFLNLKRITGMSLADLDGDLLFRILPHLAPTSQGMPVAVRCRIGNPSMEFDGLLHRPPAGTISNWSDAFAIA